MKTLRNTLYFVLCNMVLVLVSCEPKAFTSDDVFVSGEETLTQELNKENPEGYRIYTLNEFLDTFMTEEGNFASDTCPYRTRSTDGSGIFLYSVDTLPTNGQGIYIRGRVTTDDYAGNFYKSMVIQQIVDGAQQNLRLSVDLGSSHGLYQTGQEILVRCNGLAVGRYANQPQLCVPSYNNNIYAMNASQKVGWCPGRIPGPVFRRNTRLIGLPDQSKIKYDTLNLVTLYSQIVRKPTTINAETMDAIRKADGRLVVITNVAFTGQFNDNGNLAECDTQHPDSSTNANVFAPTTNNIGFPQGRVLKDPAGNVILSSCSEYAKFAYYYLPGADKNGVANCQDWEGSITGILGWYLDKASELSKLTGYEWSVTPRGIPGIGISDINLKNGLSGESWIPTEFNPNDYISKK